MNKKIDPIFLLTNISFGLAIFLFGGSFYFQYVEHLNPCPLCITQRIAVFLLVLFCGWALFIKSKRSFMINAGLQLFSSLLGTSVAARQVWLSHLPVAEQGGCLPDISILWQYLPFVDMIKLFFRGSVSCSEVSWTWLHMTLPEWSCIFFVIFTLVIVSRVFFYKSIPNHSPS